MDPNRIDPLIAARALQVYVALCVFLIALILVQSFLHSDNAVLTSEIYVRAAPTPVLAWENVP